MIKPRYLIEITDGPSMQYSFSYVDTEDNLAYLLFDHLDVDVEPDMEFHCDGDPYKIVVCRIPREHRDAFLRAIDLLPAFMDYAGKKDYEDYCREFFMNAGLFFRGRNSAGNITPLQ